MRIIVVLHPTNKRGTKISYTNFRNRLLANGFVLMAPEIFMKISTNRKSAKVQVERIAPFAPDTGVIRVLLLTEKQHRNMMYLVGEPDYQEQKVGGHCHVSL